LQAYPLWEFALSYDLLRDTPNVASPSSPFNELKTLLGFFLARQGAFDSFLFDDVTDDGVTTMVFGTGGGGITNFQLIRTYGGFSEPVQNVNGAPSIFINDVLKSTPADYTIGATGIVTFTPAPSPGQVLTWTGNYYYRCRFLADTHEYNQFMKNLWENRRVEFVGTVSNKV
jgi:uncharacterized protein (TIGR02217 family)